MYFQRYVIQTGGFVLRNVRLSIYDGMVVTGEDSLSHVPGNSENKVCGLRVREATSLVQG